MRHKPWADDYLAENAHIALANPEQYKGNGMSCLEMIIQSISKSVQEKGVLLPEWASFIRR